MEENKLAYGETSRQVPTSVNKAAEKVLAE